MTPRLALAVSATLLLAACANATRSTAADAMPQTPTISAPANGPLWRSDGGSIIPASGSVDASVLCQSISVNLRRDHAQPPASKAIGQPFPCRKTSLYLGYLRSTLFIEGLDKNGARLFVATGDNPLHQDVEVPPGPTGGDMSWHAIESSSALVTTMIGAPITPALVRLRWYDVDEKFQPRPIGETAWTGVAPIPQ